MQDQEFFSSDNVYVSLTRFIVSGQTYAMSGVTSVRASEIGPNRFGPALIALIAIACFFIGGDWIYLGALMAGAAIWLWYLQEPEYFVLLRTSSGEVRALKSDDRKFIEDVVQAVNDSIVARG